MSDTPPDISRLDALTRSRKTLQQAMRLFHAMPSTQARTAVELAMEACQRADLLWPSPEAHRADLVRQWTDAWLAAHVAVYKIIKHRRQN